MRGLLDLTSRIRGSASASCSSCMKKRSKWPDDAASKATMECAKLRGAPQGCSTAQASGGAHKTGAQGKGLLAVGVAGACGGCVCVRLKPQPRIGPAPQRPCLPLDLVFLFQRPSPPHPPPALLSAGAPHAIKRMPLSRSLRVRAYPSCREASPRTTMVKHAASSRSYRAARVLQSSSSKLSLAASGASRDLLERSLPGASTSSLLDRLWRHVIRRNVACLCKIHPQAATSRD